MEKKEESRQSQHDTTKDPYVSLTYNQVSHVVAGVFVVCFFTFVSGYYWGKRVSHEAVYDSLEQDALSDQLKKAFYVDMHEEDVGDEGAFLKDDTISSQEEDTSSKPTESLAHTPDIQHVDVDNDSSSVPTEEYAAHLVGFGTYQAAQKCVDIYKNHGYVVSISERTGKTARGESRTWYQVVTPWYQDKNRLNDLLPQLKKIGKLKEVTLVVRDKK
jgi:hypothetical protein